MRISRPGKTQSPEGPRESGQVHAGQRRWRPEPPCLPAGRRHQVSLLACWVVRGGVGSEEKWLPKKGLPALPDAGSSRPVPTDSFADAGGFRRAANADQSDDGCLETCCNSARCRSCFRLFTKHKLVYKLSGILGSLILSNSFELNLKYTQ